MFYFVKFNVNVNNTKSIFFIFLLEAISLVLHFESQNIYLLAIKIMLTFWRQPIQLIICHYYKSSNL